MPRIRTIKPEHVNDKELPKISLQAHLLWVLNWCFSDDEGIFENDPLLIKSIIFPRRTDVRIEQINQWLDQLVKARYIIPFTHNGVGYYINRTFRKHQRIDKPQPSKIPEDVILRTFQECSENVPPCIVEESKGKDGKGAASPEKKSDSLENFTKEQKASFDNFQKWLLNDAPNVAKMKNPFTIDQYLKIAKDFKADVIKDLINKMDNWADLNKKNVYAYKTFLNWSKRQFPETKPAAPAVPSTDETFKKLLGK